MQKLLHSQLDCIRPASIYTYKPYPYVWMYACMRGCLHACCATATVTQGCAGITLAVTICLWIPVGGYGIVSVIGASLWLSCCSAHWLAVFLLVYAVNWWVVASICMYVGCLRMRAIAASKWVAQTTFSLVVYLCLLKPCNLLPTYFLAGLQLAIAIKLSSRLKFSFNLFLTFLIVASFFADTVLANIWGHITCVYGV